MSMMWPSSCNCAHRVLSEPDTTYKKLVRALEIMKKYPKEYKHFKEQISRIQENFNKVAEII
jgi:hypothetical protein